MAPLLMPFRSYATKVAVTGAETDLNVHLLMFATMLVLIALVVVVVVGQWALSKLK
jgi:hypothetical protein